MSERNMWIGETGRRRATAPPQPSEDDAASVEEALPDITEEPVRENWDTEMLPVNGMISETWGWWK